MKLSRCFLVLLCFLGFSMADFSKSSEYSRVMRSGQCRQECAKCGDGYSCATSCSMCAKPDCKCASYSMDDITIPNTFGWNQMWSDIKPTLDECKSSCSYIVGCLAYSYRESLQLCELYDDTPSGNLQLVEEEGVTLYIRKCYRCEDIKQ